jgi:eukaryotic-like serine/threonine-protein kinase
MSAIQYLKSKTFLKQLGLAMVFFVLLVFLFMNLLSLITNHGEEIIVPNVVKLNLDEAESKLENLDLQIVILDTLDFNIEFPPFAIVNQNPIPGSKVKKNRKIYLKVNSDGFAMVELPEIRQKTFRQVESLLRIKGLVLGKITYKPDLGKDMVLEVTMNGKTLNAGDKVMKTSAIDLVLGDGKVSFDDSEFQDLFNDESEEQ